jgi:hypothetical protein
MSGREREQKMGESIWRKMMQHWVREIGDRASALGWGDRDKRILLV